MITPCLALIPTVYYLVEKHAWGYGAAAKSHEPSPNMAFIYYYRVANVQGEAGQGWEFLMVALSILIADGTTHRNFKAPHLQSHAMLLAARENGSASLHAEKTAQEPRWMKTTTVCM